MQESPAAGVDERRLADPGRPVHRDDRSWRHIQVDVGQHGPIPADEIHPAQQHRTGCRRIEVAERHHRSFEQIVEIVARIETRLGGMEAGTDSTQRQIALRREQQDHERGDEGEAA